MTTKTGFLFDLECEWSEYYWCRYTISAHRPGGGAEQKVKMKLDTGEVTFFNPYPSIDFLWHDDV